VIESSLRMTCDRSVRATLACHPYLS